MAESVLSYDDIVDLRFNPGTGEFSPVGIGYGAVPTENHIIPSSSPYIIKLFESPQHNAPSTTVITIDGVELTEVSNTVTPGINQYRVWYYPELGAGQIEFNSAKAGKEAVCKYYGLGTIHQKILLDTRVPDTGNTNIGGIKTFTNTTDSSSSATGAVILDGGLGVAKNVNVGVALNCWKYDEGNLISTTDAQAKNFYLKKPISAYFVGNDGYLDIYQNSGYRSIAGGAGHVIDYVLHLNPGRYRIRSIALGNDATLQITGVYGITSISFLNTDLIEQF